MDPALRQLVTDVAAAERCQLATVDTTPARTRFLRYAERRKLVRRWRAAAVVAAASVLGALVYAWQPSSALNFEVEGQPGEVGDFLVAPKNSSVLVDFSDGSRLSLQHEARARVLDLDARGASLMLEQGVLQASVVHQGNTRWQVNAGPFRVQVVGTRFEVTWDPVKEQFTLELFEGSVNVTGPELSSDCRLHAGARLSVRASQGQAHGACVEQKLNPQPEPARQAPKPAPEPALESNSLPGPAATNKPPPPSWRTLAHRGDHRAAWSRVKAVGLGAVKADANAQDLMLLADVARFAGQPSAAQSALLDVRKRFPDAAQAADAAFLLGRVAADQQGAPVGGAHWFETYLRERPRGAYASEALGRLLDCQKRAGQHMPARATAQRYLKRYPDGPYRALAEHLAAPSADKRLDASRPPEGRGSDR